MVLLQQGPARIHLFPISRDPPEGGTLWAKTAQQTFLPSFPISRDPPEGGTTLLGLPGPRLSRFQFLGIPPKGELEISHCSFGCFLKVSNF